MSADPSATQNRALRAILWGGLLAGLGDYLFAHIFYGKSLYDWHMGPFKTVAGGIIGREAARAGGVPTYLLGVSLHFLIAAIWAAIYWALSRRLPMLVKYTLPAGLVYGLVVYYGMNCVVVPFSALQSAVRLPPLLSWPAAAHLVLVGLPIALAARKFSRPPIND